METKWPNRQRTISLENNKFCPSILSTVYQSAIETNQGLKNLHFFQYLSSYCIPFYQFRGRLFPYLTFDKVSLVLVCHPQQWTPWCTQYYPSTHQYLLCTWWVSYCRILRRNCNLRDKPVSSLILLLLVLSASFLHFSVKSFKALLLARSNMSWMLTSTQFSYFVVIDVPINIFIILSFIRSNCS